VLRHRAGRRRFTAAPEAKKAAEQERGTMGKPRASALGIPLLWQEDAACLGKEDLFYGPSRESRTARISRERRAKQVCGICPVLAACARFALSTREPYGLWGGLTARERERVHTIARAQGEARAAALAGPWAAREDRSGTEAA
jgi:WhiB family redox-sensing transcriptional regulator